MPQRGNPITLKPAVFLDRDGVVCRSIVRDGKPYAVRTLSEFRLVPHAAASVQLLKQAGFIVVIVTNQPDIGAGLVDRSVVDSMHARLRSCVDVDAIMTCPHTRSDRCECRKPKAGMLFEAANRFAIDLCASVLVGDRASDIEAGRAANCHTIFIDRHYREPRPEHADQTTTSLAGATRLILRGVGSHHESDWYNGLGQGRAAYDN